MFSSQYWQFDYAKNNFISFCINFFSLDWSCCYKFKTLVTWSFFLSLSTHFIRTPYVESPLKLLESSCKENSTMWRTSFTLSKFALTWAWTTCWSSNINWAFWCSTSLYNFFATIFFKHSFILKKTFCFTTNKLCTCLMMPSRTNGRGTVACKTMWLFIVDATTFWDDEPSTF